jgi:hypothetical protein
MHRVLAALVVVLAVTKSALSLNGMAVVRTKLALLDGLPGRVVFLPVG